MPSHRAHCDRCSLKNEGRLWEAHCAPNDIFIDEDEEYFYLNISNEHTGESKNVILNYMVDGLIEALRNVQKVVDGEV